VIREIVAAGECGAYIRFGTVIDPDTSALVQAFAALLRDLRRTEITDVVPGYVSVYVEFDVQRMTVADLQRIVEEITPPKVESAYSGDLIDIPVCYGDSCGPDLTQVAAECAMSEADVIDIHSSREYLVFFLGFTPGFPFMGTVDERIAVPRLRAPRTKVPAGSVGIAGYQTGVYPVDSPGGWRLIGRTTEPLVDLSGSEPRFLLSPRCRVRFLPTNPGHLQHATSNISRGLGSRAHRTR
jgi:KipI family sensor histidine kinase inhibitor